MSALGCFKAYDIRGRLGVDLDEGIAYRIGRAFARALDARTVVLGRDIRASSEALAARVAEGLGDEGCRVLDLGLSGTEEMYAATSHFGADGGICVTASHNPMDYNGMKMVRQGSAPLDAASGLARIRELAEAEDFGAARPGGAVMPVAEEARRAYVERVLSFVEVEALKPLKILVNAGHGAAGPTFDAIAARLEALGAPLSFERMHHAPDGTFPAGIPNPLLPENRPATAARVRETGADFGVAWDGDFDRCFFFDHEGRFIDGEYVVGLLAEAFLARHPGATVIHDPRIIWNTQDVVARAGGRAVQTRTGHAFIKQAMRDEAALYGGEMSAHHYFRDFYHCDSGMIPLAARGRAGEPPRPPRGSGGGPQGGLSLVGRAQFRAGGSGGRDGAGAAGLRARGAGGGRDGRARLRPRLMALQPAEFEHRARGAAECRGEGQAGAGGAGGHGGEGAASADGRLTVRRGGCVG